MRCLQCYSNDCIHVSMSLGGMAGIASQQQMQSPNLDYMAYLQGQAARVMNEEISKAYASKPQRNKKLLLIRK